jgi:hypothetical protein
MQSQKFIGDSMGPNSAVLTKSAMSGCMLKANLSIINRISCQLFSRNIHHHHHHNIITIITTTNIIIITITTTFIIII